MKKIRKTIIVVLGILAISTTPVTVHAKDKIPVVITCTVERNSRSNIIEWRYQYFNGKLYRHLYNASTQEWVGDWELVK